MSTNDSRSQGPEGGFNAPSQLLEELDRDGAREPDGTAKFRSREGATNAPGDSMPWVKDPPEVLPLFALKDNADPLETSADPAAYPALGQPIAVGGARTLTLLIDYAAGDEAPPTGAAAGRLGLVVENNPNPAAPTAPGWFPIGVVDAFLQYDTSSTAYRGWGYRNFFASEFRLDPSIDGTAAPVPPAAGSSRRATLVFYLTPYRGQMRVRAAELNALVSTSVLRVWAKLGR